MTDGRSRYPEPERVIPIPRRSDASGQALDILNLSWSSAGAVPQPPGLKIRREYKATKASNQSIQGTRTIHPGLSRWTSRPRTMVTLEYGASQL